MFTSTHLMGLAPSLLVGLKKNSDKYEEKNIKDDFLRRYLKNDTFRKNIKDVPIRNPIQGKNNTSQALKA